MSGALTATRSNSSSYTDARLRAVMPEVGGDFYSLAAAGIITFDTATAWTEDLLYVLQYQAATGFQVQLVCAGRAPIALDYRVSSDGTIQESGTSGGIDYFALPAGTRATLFVSLNRASRNIATVDVYTARRGWGTGQAVQGPITRDRAYSKDGYGVIRGKIGTWP
jgi:hypothetical protein